MITAIDKNTALVLIDLQNGVVRMDLAHPVQDVLANAVRLINAFRAKGLPIVIVNVDPWDSALVNARVERPLLPHDPEQRKKALQAYEASGFSNIVPEIVIEPHDILITKQTWNAFTNPALHTELQKHAITGIVLAGVSASVGVEGTARAACEHGYNLSFALDAMTDRLAEAYNHTVNNIFPRIGETGNTQEIIDKLPN